MQEAKKKKKLNIDPSNWPLWQMRIPRCYGLLIGGRILLNAKSMTIGTIDNGWIASEYEHLHLVLLQNLNNGTKYPIFSNPSCPDNSLRESTLHVPSSNFFCIN